MAGLMVCAAIGFLLGGFPGAAVGILVGAGLAAIVVLWPLTLLIGGLGGLVWLLLRSQ